MSTVSVADALSTRSVRFPGLTIEKLKAGFFNGPQIRKLMNDHEFPSSMSKEEFYAWDAFVKVVKNFFGNKKASNYKELVAIYSELF